MLEIRIDQEAGKQLRRIMIGLVVALLALWAAWIVREVWLPLIIAFLIAMVLDPLVDRLETRGWTRLASAALIYTVFFVLSAVVLTLAVPAVIGQTTQIANQVGQYLPGDDETQTKHALHRLLDRMQATPFLAQSILRASQQITTGFHKLSAYVGSMAQGMMVNLLWMVIIPILSFYMLKDFHIIYARFLLLVPAAYRNNIHQITNEVSAIFARYLRGLMIVCALNGVMTAALLMVLRVPNALALGAISGMLYMVPYFGAVLITALAGGVTFIAYNSIQSALLVMLALFILHSVIFDYLITPRIMASNVGLHPILSMVALLIGGGLLGILGMILAVPIAATLQLIVTAIFPRLIQPIEVPTGEQLHGLAADEEKQSAESDVEVAHDLHQTIIHAVEEAEEQGIAAAGGNS